MTWSSKPRSYNDPGSEVTRDSSRSSSIVFADLRQYLREDDARRKGVADEPMELDQELGPR